MKKHYLIIAVMVAIIGIIQACAKLAPGSRAENEVLDGPVKGLSFEESRRFIAGDIAFNDDIFTSQTGLGSVFVATSCGTCHDGDGKRHPFTTLTRFGQMDDTGNQYLHMGGPQLQNRALPGYTPEQIPPGATFSKFTPPAITGLGFLELVPDADIIALSDLADANGDGISGIPNWITLPSFLLPAANAVSQNG